jgi:hypothetical protein
MSIAAAAAEKQARSSWITGGKFQILDSDTIPIWFNVEK